MTGLARWPVRCTLMGCTRPSLPGHHHHMHRGHLDVRVCRCAQPDQPGTRPA